MTVSKRTGPHLLSIAWALAVTTSTAQAGQPISVDCWKRLSDGDIHVDTSKHPEIEDYNILHFKANRSSDGWDYGRCVIDPRPYPPSKPLGVTLPLQDGDYTRGECASGRSNILESIGLYTTIDGPQKGRRFLSPNGEGLDGACDLGKIDVSGTRFSGSGKCEGGGSRIQYNMGTYRFSYEILDNRTFVSKGKKYVWCAKGR